MQQKHKILIGIAAIQTVFVLLGFAGKKDLEHYAGDDPLLSAGQDAQNFADSISEIVINAAQKSIKITKKEDSWVLPDFYDFPAQQERVKQLLQNLSQLKKGWPVGTTAVAAKQLKTAQEDFEKQIVLLQDGKVVHTIYIGSSPSFKKVHMRVDDSNDTYVLPFETYRVSTYETSWRDGDLLKRPKEEISEIRLGKLKLVKNDDDVWQLSDLKESEEMVTDAVDRVVSAIANLRFSDVLGDQNKKEYQQQKPVLQFTIIFNDKPQDYRFSISSSKSDKDSTYNYVFKTSAERFYFQINRSNVDAIKKATRKSLVKRKAAKSS
ncbi:MAG: DUF4340 domain-containing protein [Myxococcota bacterium]